MKKGTVITLIVVAILAIALGQSGCSTYNSLVTLSADAEQSWADVQAQYQRRFDLIPNLVETVKGYAAHESETYEKVTEARAGLTSAYDSAKQLENTEVGSADFSKYTDAQAGLNRALSIYVNAVREAYPDLKANEQFLNLQTQLEGTENRIAAARIYYNEKVKAYNIKAKRFPSNIWASLFGFSTLTPFAADQAAQAAPKVSF